MIAILTEIHQHGYHSTDILEAAGLSGVLGTYTLNKAFLLAGTLEEETATKDAGAVLVGGVNPCTRHVTYAVLEVVEKVHVVPHGEVLVGKGSRGIALCAVTGVCREVCIELAVGFPVAGVGNVAVITVRGDALTLANVATHESDVFRAVACSFPLCVGGIVATCLVCFIEHFEDFHIVPRVECGI